MKLKRTPELHAFLSAYFSDSDPDTDNQSTQDFMETSPPERHQQIIDQIRILLADNDLPLEELGTEANRWFGDSEEARAWLFQILSTLQDGEGGGAKKATAQNAANHSAKDSNGAQLSEGDSVQVIKDLKVKGSSSDLKRGTLIKKIHLIDDHEAVECRVDGSTLVLKTCFLKKI